MGPLLYKPMPKWQIFAALGGAILIHVTAAVIAGLKPAEQPADLTAIPEAVAEVTFEQAAPEPTPPPEVEEPEPLDVPPPPTEVPEFVEEQPTPPPKQRNNKPVAPIARPRPPAGAVGPVSMSTAKVSAISSPRPEYPYEARRTHTTGSGIVILTVDPSGTVTSADIAKSSGSPVLDNAATSGFQRWRFRPGSVSKVRVPFTFTLTGVQY